MRDKLFYRMVISHRAAVKCLCEIQCALSGEPRPYFYGYDRDDYKTPGGYDPSVHHMADEIWRMRKEVDEYHKLKEALKPLIGK